LTSPPLCILLLQGKTTWWHAYFVNLVVELLERTSSKFYSWKFQTLSNRIVEFVYQKLKYSRYSSINFYHQPKTVSKTLTLKFPTIVMWFDVRLLVFASILFKFKNAKIDKLTQEKIYWKSHTICISWSAYKNNGTNMFKVYTHGKKQQCQLRM
jgi:hypothetical protein